MLEKGLKSGSDSGSGVGITSPLTCIFVVCLNTYEEEGFFTILALYPYRHLLDPPPAKRDWCSLVWRVALQVPRCAVCKSSSDTLWSPSSLVGSGDPFPCPSTEVAFCPQQ